MAYQLQTSFEPVFQVNKGGVNGFDLSSQSDHTFAFDFDHSGKCDHLFFYRRGGGALAILRNDGKGKLHAVFKSTNGLPGFDFSNAVDRAFAFDWEGSGHLDYVCAYRPGTGMLTIAGNKHGKFQPVWQSSKGIDGYDLLDIADRAFAFDYEHSGKRNHICLYRSGYGIFHISRHIKDTFETAFWTNGSGLGDMPFNDPKDRCCAFDYDQSGRMDYIFCYRPGKAAISIMQNNNGTFTSVWNMVNPHPDTNNLVWYSLAGFDCADPADRAFPYDFDSSGKLDHICFYRPGKGAMYVAQHRLGGWWPAYQAHGDGVAIAATLIGVLVASLKPVGADEPIPKIFGNSLYGASGYDLKDGMDRCLPYDFESTGCSDHIVMYRPGAGILWIVRRSDIPKRRGQTGHAHKS